MTSPLTTKEAGDSYYRRGGIETLDYLRAKLDDAGFEAYLVGMVHKKIHKAFLTPASDGARDELYAKAAVYMAHLSKIRTGDAARKVATDRGPRTSDLPDHFTRLAVSSPADVEHAQPPALAIENPTQPPAQARYGPSYTQRSAQ